MPCRSDINSTLLHSFAYSSTRLLYNFSHYLWRIYNSNRIQFANSCSKNTWIKRFRYELFLAMLKLYPFARMKRQVAASYDKFPWSYDKYFVYFLVNRDTDTKFAGPVTFLHLSCWCDKHLNLGPQSKKREIV